MLSREGDRIFGRHLVAGEFMPSEARIWVVIAAYNEAAVIGRVVAEGCAGDT